MSAVCNPVPTNSTSNPCPTIVAPHHHSADRLLKLLDSEPGGLTQSAARKRLQHCGPNALPQAEGDGLIRIFLRQFASPLIYVLVAAAAFSLFIREWSDAGFIGAVLLINAVIGAFQEFSAQRAAEALHNLVRIRSRVLRAGEDYEIDAEELVPGDIVLLESGSRVPADLRLLTGHDLEIDESLLTGESLAVAKQADAVLPEETPLAERRNMAFAGTLVMRGRGHGLVVATGTATELGRIASDVLERPATRAPLVERMERFTRWIAVLVAMAALLMALVALWRGMPLNEVFLMAVALAVSVIPEGLPVALTVALAVSMRRMLHRHVLIRRLVAVEALGSCTFIATDKTGTLTLNQLTVRHLVMPGDGPEIWSVTGESTEPEGEILSPRGLPEIREQTWLHRVAEAAVLANEGFLGRRDGEWVRHGDAVDVALLVLAHKTGVIRDEVLARLPEVATIPFESERQFAASLHREGNGYHAFVKGALERILPMCSRMATANGEAPLARSSIQAVSERLSADGFRIIALADGTVSIDSPEAFAESHLQDLTFLALVAMIDPLRPEAAQAVAQCRQAGIEVAMITGDHPATALAIARDLGLARDIDQVVTGAELKQVASPEALDLLTHRARVYARVEPRQKLDIVQSLQRQGHYVAVSGDGANDAPALRTAHVGVAMGASGTDVARESADIIITDDNFASIVAGVEEGRIAYGNVRKVIFLLISTGAAELVLFLLALFSGLPIPLLAVQLLWLNLVTNGIQDVALAFEPGEGNELQRPPRPPGEGVFNRLMLERVLLSALVMGSMAFGLYQLLQTRGFSLDEARNATLLLMVLFENIHVFNARSETLSVFRHNLLRNPLLLVGVAAAQGIHIAAMYLPGLSSILHIQPVSPRHWAELLGLAIIILVVMEGHKRLWQRRESTNKQRADTNRE